ncbi:MULTISPECIES: MaoC/PaaZ C-terminal domain-containing protein [unclassified Pseudomonas]|uniref:MaoC/PaaZ C-terminal domain-containing protein n=1 Tax=unclassified Pseudomonas TaxID=196821 RepID=UPI000A1F817B|nr:MULTISPECIES: MaoC/PaaZ C-terminal domain-containing protein [unclassified Pseudomonas]
MTGHWHELNIPAPLPKLFLKAALRRKISGTHLPDQGLRCLISLDPGQLAAYRKVCGFTDNGLLPVTYPHVLAFPLQMQLLTASDFPFPLLGLVHLGNRIRVLRPMGNVSSVRVGVRVGNLRAHAKGATFDLVTSIDDLLGPLWEARSEMLCRGVKLAASGPAPTPAEREPGPGLEAVANWRAESDIGRRYAKVSGDYNPIHLSAWSARLFGFPQAIAHGLWSKARTLAALEQHLPTAGVQITVRFAKPVLLPGEVRLLASAAGSSGDLQLLGKGGLQHMQGDWQPLP